MSFMEDTLIILISQTVFFVGGWIFFVKQLFRDYEVHHTLVQLIFSVTFALSCTIVRECNKTPNDVRMVHLFILLLEARRPIPHIESKTEKKLLQTMDMILVKKKRIALAEANSVGGRQSYNLLEQSNAKNRGFWNNIWSSVGSITNPYGQGTEKISGLEELSRQLFLEAHDARTMREKIDWSKTFQGKYFNFLGYFFSLYCVWKIFISTINIVFDRVGKKDPVTRGLEIIVHWLGLHIDIMGMYFCSSVLLMRMNMPAEYRVIVTQVLGDIHFNFYHRWFDVIFLVSALTSIFTLYLAHKQPS
ncbi:Protein GPR89A, partial [Operophtera brumata]